MEKITQKSLNEKLRQCYMTKVIESLKQCDDDVLQTASNEIAIPCLDEGGNDSFVVIKFSVPTGSRDGDPYDGYAIADEYILKCKEKTEKAEKLKKEKAEKIAKDKANREKLAESKKNHTEK